MRLAKESVLLTIVENFKVISLIYHKITLIHRMKIQITLVETLNVILTINVISVIYLWVVMFVNKFLMKKIS